MLRELGLSSSVKMDPDVYDLHEVSRWCNNLVHIIVLQEQ